MMVGILFTLRHKNDSEQKRTRGDKITRQIWHGSGPRGAWKVKTRQKRVPVQFCSDLNCVHSNTIAQWRSSRVTTPLWIALFQVVRTHEKKKWCSSRLSKSESANWIELHFSGGRSSEIRQAPWVERLGNAFASQVSLLLFSRAFTPSAAEVPCERAMSVDLTPSQARELARRNELDVPSTSGLCPGYEQANLVVLEQQYAADFELFCRANAAPCPLLYRSQPGQTTAPPLADDSDVR